MSTTDKTAESESILASPSSGGLSADREFEGASFNTHSLPGIAYVGKLLKPKLGFEPMDDACLRLRLHFVHGAVDLLATRRRPSIQPEGWRYEPAAFVDGDSGDAATVDVHSGNLPEQDTDAVARLLSGMPGQADDLTLKEQLGRVLLDRARMEPDEAQRAQLLDASIAQLMDASAGLSDTNGLHTLIGEAGYRRLLIGPSIDAELLAVTESALRKASDLSAVREAAQMLHELLILDVPGQDRDDRMKRLDEARTRVLQWLAEPSSDSAKWREALLRVDVLLSQQVSRNVTARRLRLRELCTEHAAAMQGEAEPGVLAAWLDMLCAAAAALGGHAAQVRHEEAEGVLARLRALDTSGRIYAQALSSFVLARQSATPRATLLDLLRQAEAAVNPIADEDPPLRLQAARLALAQAQLVPSDHAEMFYQEALTWARPLTSSPSLMLPALRIVLTALLATGESTDRRVYSRFLDILVAADDVESLGLLAEVAFSDQRHVEGCRYCARLWRAGGQPKAEVLRAWEEGLATWAAAGGDEDDFAANRNCLRMARASR